MCCLVLLGTVFGPRIVFVLNWLFGVQVDQAIPSLWAKLLGVIVAPWTALFYAIAWAPGKGVGFAGWCLVALGVLLDISAYGAGAEQRRRQGRSGPSAPPSPAY